MKKKPNLRHWFHGAGSQIFRAMKCLTLFLVIFTFYSYTESYSQSTKLKLNINQATVLDVIEDIEKQSEFVFIYADDILPQLNQVKGDINVKNKSIIKVLDKILDEKEIHYIINERQVVLKKAKNRSLVDKNSKNKNIPVQKQISGVVTDASNVPLPGVNVVLKGSTKGTQTDFDGNYVIQASEGDVLQFSYLGFETKDVTVGAQSTINVVMKDDVAGLDEVVVVGYGSQKKASLTSAVVSVKAETIESIPTSQLSNNLAGRLPGVQIIGNSGLVGASSSINIRGTGVNALYVIDNVISDKAQFDVLDPSEVETVTVLKDAAAAAIYGARASGGVVLITTKKGKVGKVSFNYGSIYTTNILTKPLQDYTAEEELIYKNNVAIHRNQINPDPDFQPPYGEDVLAFSRGINYRNVNDEIWRSPSSQQHTLSVSGGSERITYFFSTGFNQAKGSYDNTNFDRYNFRAKVSAEITDNITLSTNLSGNRRETDRFFWPFDGDNGEGFEVSDFYRSTFNLSRLYPFYAKLDGTPSSVNDPDAVAVVQPGWGFNPAEVVNSDSYRKILYNTFNGIVNMDITIPQIKGLSVSVQGNYRQDVRNRKNFVLLNRSLRVQTVGGPGSGIDEFTLTPLVTDGSQDVVNNLGRSFPGIDESFSFEESTQINGLLKYQNVFGDHSINTFVGFEQAKSSFKLVSGSASDLLSTSIDQILSASTSSDRRDFSGFERKTARLSYLGRATYSFVDKYIAELSFRYDGSYKFPSGKRFGFFPSVSAAWRVSQEDFFTLDAVSNFKLRASFGQTGFDGDDNRPIAPFQFQNNFQRGASYVFENGLRDGIRPQSIIPNPNITWETHTTWNAGFDLGLFENQFDLTFDIFKNSIADILAPTTVTVPGTFGSDLPQTNVAERKINGFEIAANYQNNNNAVKYQIGANMGYAKDEWISYPEADGLKDFQSRIGRPNDLVIGYISKGIIRDQATIDALPAGFTQFGRVPQLGEILFEDIRGDNFSDGPDGIVNSNDVDILSENTIPRINYGITGNVKWNGFSVDVFFQGVGAYDKYVSTRNTRSGGVFQTARPYFALWTDAWSAENPDGKYPRAENNWNQIENGHGPSTFWERSGAYLRLKNLNVAYSIPNKIIEPVGFDKISLFINGTNLFVISEFDEYDPEQATLDSYPLFKTYSLGVNLSF